MLVLSRLVRRLPHAACASILLALLAALPLAGLLAPAAEAARNSRGARNVAIQVGGAAIVATTEGDQLSLREGPGRDYAVLTTFPAGTELVVLDGPAAGADGMGWYQVRGDGLTGWCSADWLVAAGSDAPPPALAADPAPGVPNGALHIGGTDGEGARLRDAPGLSSAIVLVIPEGGPVFLDGGARRADGYDWAPVSYGESSGWVATAFLAGGSPVRGATNSPSPEASGGPDAASETSPAPVVVSAAPLAAGDRAAVIDTDGFDLRIRDGVGLDAPILGYAPAGAVLLVVNGSRPDATGAAWYGIDYDGLTGWVLGEHLAHTDAAPSRRPVPAAPAPSQPAPASPPPTPTTAPRVVAASPERGRAIVDEALKHLGAPYLWGGQTPAGWDCSGFILYVYQRAAGVALPRVTQDQFRVGASLRPDEVQAGDIVFFTDTDGPGITHNGIALGDGRFIHSRSAAYGTVISNLADPYWTKHYAGARRP